MTESKGLEGVKFEIPGQPFGKQRPRVVNQGGFSRAYTPKETVSYENLVKICWSDAAQGFKFPDDAMLNVQIAAYYAIPKSTSKKKRQMMLEHRLRPTKKPDFDNIGKIICDSLNLIAYHDDSCIVDAQVSKFYSEKPRVEVIIKSIEKEED